MARYMLMNKNTEVLEFDYDLETRQATRIVCVAEVLSSTPPTSPKRASPR